MEYIVCFFLKPAVLKPFPDILSRVCEDQVNVAGPAQLMNADNAHDCGRVQCADTVKIQNEIAQFFLRLVTDAVTDSDQQALRGAEEYESLQSQDVDLPAQPLYFLDMFERTFHGTAEVCAAEHIVDDVDMSVVDSKKHDRTENANTNTLKESHWTNHNENAQHQQVIQFWQTEPRI